MTGWSTRYLSNSKVGRCALDERRALERAVRPAFEEFDVATDPCGRMEWLWTLFEPYVLKQFNRQGVEAPSDAALQDAFTRLVSECTVTILVQEPWRGSVRFKGLDKLPATEAFELLHDPESYLFERFGGGKFKLNFHEGWNFVATQNFKPEGEPAWKELPRIDF